MMTFISRGDPFFSGCDMSIARSRFLKIATRARTLSARNALRAISHGICIILAPLSSAAAADARPDQIAAASDHCAKAAPNDFEQAGRLNDDRTILCFDGNIPYYLDLTPVLRLKTGGIAVVRSVGGAPGMAMNIADVLWEKDATLVVRDYCLSACANALFVATQRTYVLAHTVVAWHGGPAGCADRNVATAFKRLYRECQDYGRDFYAKRGLSREHMTAPQTKQTRDRFYLALDGALEKSSVFWMWHPANHRSYFKERVTYEAYPGSQSAVDAILVRQRFQALRLVYDHPID